MKLKLVLKNFKKFADATWVFDEGLTLISGKSGQGKSTIFMAILFALTGEGKKLISFGKTSCSVTLTADNFVVITRTKHPNRLLLQHSQGSQTGSQTTNKFLEDEEAQAVINQYFFQYHLGYIAQRSTKSFLLLSPQDKLSFIERMVFGEENPDIVHVCCKSLVKERKDALAAARASREATEALLKEMNIRQTNIDSTTTNSIPDVQKALAQHRFELKEAILNLDRARENEKRRIFCSSRLNQLTHELKELFISLDLPTEPKTSLDDIENELERVKAYNKAWSEYKKQKKILKDIDVTQHQIICKQQSTIKDCKRVCELAATANSTQFAVTLTNLNDQIAKAVTYFVCPECNTTLQLWGNTIKKTISEVKDKTRPLQVLSCAEVKKLEEQQTRALLAFEDSLSNQKELLSLCARYPDIFKHVDTSETNLQSTSVAKTLRAISDIASNYIARVAESRRVLEKYDRQKFLCDSLRPKDKNHKITFETENLLRRTRDVLQEIKEIKKTLARDNHQFQSVKDWELKVVVLEKATEESESVLSFLEAAQYWIRVGALAQEENARYQGFANATKLQDIVKTSSKQSILQVVEEINTTVQPYIDLFIEDVVAELTFDKGKLNVDVIQNGHRTDLHVLSGGEFARVLLAFTIALAEINNVKLLMIDETTASLDQDTTTSVVDVIKKHFKGTVLVIAHQTTTGVFDTVIDLDTKADEL